MTTTTAHEAPTDVSALDLDYDLVCHLPDPEALSTLRAEQFSADLIEDPIAKNIFIWQMEHVREYASPATAAVLQNEFPLTPITSPRSKIGDLIGRIRSRYMRNKGREIARQISIAVHEQPLEAPKLMLRGGRELSDLVVKRGEVFGTGDHWRLMALYDKRATRGQGPSLGYPELDDHFNGMLGVTFVIGPPKSGKSWFTINVIKENITQERFPYVYSLELPADEYTMRLEHMVADVPYWKFLKGAYMEDDRHKLLAAAELLDATGKYRIEKPQPGDRGVQRMVERALNVGADCVIIDQLQYVENRKGINLGSANNTGDYWEVCNDLRDYSDQIPIFVVHQFNRSILNAKEMPEAQQAKGSAAVEEVATLALGLWAPKEDRKLGLMQVGTLASRNYAYETWELSMQLSDNCCLEMRGVVEPEDDE